MAEKKEPTEAQARKAVEAAQEDLADAQQGLSAAVARGGMAHLTVEVAEGNTSWHNGVAYGPGESYHVEGLTAVGLAQQGHVTITGTHSGELPDPEETRKQTIEAEKKQLRSRLKELDAAK